MTRGWRGRLGVSVVFAVGAPGLTAAQIWLYKRVIDEVLVPRDLHAFVPIAAAYLGVGLGIGVVGFADNWLADWLGERFVLDLRTRLFDHLQGLSVDFFDRTALGDTLSRLTSDIDSIEALVVSGITRTITYTCQIIFFTTALFYLNWQLAAVSILAAPAFGGLARVFSTRIRRAARHQRHRAGSVTAVAEESLANIALVQAYNRRDAQTHRFHAENLRRFRAEMRGSRLRALFSPLIEALEITGVLAVLGLGCWELTQGRISLGGVLVFSTYLTQLYQPIQGAGRLSNTAYAAVASAERVIEVLTRRPQVTEPAHPYPLARARGAVEFSRVLFAYPDTRQLAVRDVSFTVAPGQRVAVVGASGSGKSTLAKLLLRFYDPTAGTITLDGIDLRELSVESLRTNIATVLQETLVFDATIAENILWGRPQASADELIAAAINADAHEFISALPHTYDTRIGQRGRLLSGGQRQRLAIARAMIRDAPVLLLDEPTTGLDAASTHTVTTAMRRLMTGRTTLIISHNLLSVTDADHILYLDNGRITATGTHPELLATCPNYAHLYHLHHPHTGENHDHDPTVMPATHIAVPAPSPGPAGHPRPSPGTDAGSSRATPITPLPRQPPPRQSQPSDLRLLHSEPR